MIINERDLRHQSVVEAAHRMMTAARTAPKAKGVDIIEIALVEEREDLEKLAEAMRRRARRLASNSCFATQTIFFRARQ